VRLEPVNGFILWSQPVHRQTICKQCRRSRDSRKEIFPPSPTAAPRRRMGAAIDADSQGRNPAKAREPHTKEEIPIHQLSRVQKWSSGIFIDTPDPARGLHLNHSSIFS